MKFDCQNFEYYSTLGQVLASEVNKWIVDEIRGISNICRSFYCFPYYKTPVTSHTFISLTATDAATAAAAIYTTKCIHAGGLAAWYQSRSVHMYNLPGSSYEFIWHHICTEIDVVSQSTEGKHLTKQQILSTLLNYYTCYNHKLGPYYILFNNLRLFSN